MAESEQPLVESAIKVMVDDAVTTESVLNKFPFITPIPL